MTNCIAIDWLQLHVSVPFRNYEQVKSRFFDVIKAPLQTQSFKALYYIHDKQTGEEVAVMAAEPRNEMCMQENSAIIKIVNKFLYQQNFSHFVRLVLQDLQLSFINITRLDIAYDFQTFLNMSVREFCHSLDSNLFLKEHKCKSRTTKTTTSVEKGQLTGGIESLKFGLETSKVNYQLYNKTLEMSQKTFKPWIAEHWQSNGYDGIQEVWRLEFSLHSDSRGIVLPGGEILTFKDLSLLDRIEDVYKHYFNQHFNFVIAEQTKKGNWKKQSRCKKVVLFDDMVMAPVKIKLSNKKDSGRSSKIFAKNLMKLNQELRGQQWDLAIAGNELMSWIIKTRNLEAWAKKKLPDIQCSDRVVHLIEKGRNSNLQMELNAFRELPSIYKSQPQQEHELIMQEQVIKRDLIEFNHADRLKNEMNVTKKSKSERVIIQLPGQVAMYGTDGRIIDYIDCPF